MPNKTSGDVQIRRLSAGQPRGRRAIKAVTLGLETSAGKRADARHADHRRWDGALNALRRPLEEMIAADPSAAAGLAKLRKKTFESIPPLSRVAPPRSHLGSSTAALTLTNPLCAVAAPYDFDWRWGNFLKAPSDRFTGRIAVQGASGAVPNGSSDDVAAAAGIGLLLTTDRPVNVSVRPWIDIVHWSYFVGATGYYCSGSATGGIDAAAFHDGNRVAGVRRTVEFSWSEEHRESGDHGAGFAWTPDVELNFSMVPGQAYVVNYGAWIECDHKSLAGVGGSQALVDARVVMIFVERSPL